MESPETSDALDLELGVNLIKKGLFKAGNIQYLLFTMCLHTEHDAFV